MRGTTVACVCRRGSSHAAIRDYGALVRRPRLCHRWAPALARRRMAQMRRRAETAWRLLRTARARRRRHPSRRERCMERARSTTRRSWVSCVALGLGPYRPLRLPESASSACLVVLQGGAGGMSVCGDVAGQVSAEEESAVQSLGRLRPTRSPPQRSEGGTPSADSDPHSRPRRKRLR